MFSIFPKDILKDILKNNSSTLFNYRTITIGDIQDVANQLKNKFKVEVAHEIPTVSKNENGLTVEIEVPGFIKNEIKVHTTDDKYFITAKNTKRDFDGEYDIPVGTELTSVNYENGILIINFTKIKPVENKKEVKIN